MKKFTFILVALAIAAVAFAQNGQAIKLSSDDIQSSTIKSGWEGSTDLASLAPIAPGYEYAIRFTAGELTAGDEITIVKFYGDHENYTTSGLTGTSYTIKIYEGGSFDETAGVDEITANGSEVYSQDYTATASGPQEVTLTTPYEIGSGEFWVSIVCNDNCGVFMGAADASSAYKYVQTRYDETNSVDIWTGNEYCTDPSCTETAFFPWYLSVYVDDGGAYVENSDLYAMFLDDATAPHTAISELAITGTEDLVVYPALGNSGPDATSNSVNILATVDGNEIVNQDIDMSGENALDVGYFTFLAPDPFSITVTADELNTLGVTGTFDVCLTVTYAGVDNVANNNQDCISVTRGSVDISDNSFDAISVYPNPANNVITVANAENANIVVLNMVGEVVSIIENASTNQTIDISNLSDGTYFVRVDTEVFKINVVK